MSSRALNCDGNHDTQDLCEYCVSLLSTADAPSARCQHTVSELDEDSFKCKLI